jgi:RNA polymerase sigma-70 factor, ECF subfamily
VAEDEGEIYRRYADRVRLYGLRHLRDETAAQDLVQQVLIAVLEALREGRVEDLSLLDRFVLGTARNVVAQLRRKERRTATFTVRAAAGESEAVFADWWPKLDRTRLELCFAQLGARDQRVLLLSFQEELAGEEIARELATTAGNVRVIRHRALASLQRCVLGEEAAS